MLVALENIQKSFFCFLWVGVKMQDLKKMHDVKEFAI